MLKYSLYIFVVLFSAQEAYSQTPASTSQPVFTVEYRVMSWNGGIWDLYQPPPNPREKPEFFTVPSYMPSRWFKYTGPFPLHLYKKGETRTLPPSTPGGEEIEVPRPVALLYPKGSGKWLFLLLRDQDENGDLFFKTFAVKDESLDLKTGYQFINLSSSELAIQLNEQLHQLGPNQRYHFVPKPLDDGTVDMKIAEKKDGKWELVNSNTLIIPKRGLTTVFLSKVGRKLWIRRFVDQPSSE